MSNRIVFVLAIVGAFLVGGIVANIDLIAEATGGNGDGAWAKLVARVTALEERVTILEENPTNNMLFKQLNDDAAGDAVGWNPDGDPEHLRFTISDADVNLDSMVLVNVGNNLGGNVPNCAAEAIEGGFNVECGNSIVREGATLNYIVINAG